MKKILLVLLFYFISIHIYASELKFEKMLRWLNSPWSLSFLDKENIIFTEKSGNLYTFNLKNKEISIINHNLNVLDYGQGGLLDVLYSNGVVYISYSEKRGNPDKKSDWATSTSVAKGQFNKNRIKFNNISKISPSKLIQISLLGDLIVSQ